MNFSSLSTEAQKLSLQNTLGINQFSTCLRFIPLNTSHSTAQNLRSSHKEMSEE